jgi:hypothetical protein
MTQIGSYARAVSVDGGRAPLLRHAPGARQVGTWHAPGETQATLSLLEWAIREWSATAKHRLVDHAASSTIPLHHTPSHAPRNPQSPTATDYRTSDKPALPFAIFVVKTIEESVPHTAAVFDWLRPWQRSSAVLLPERRQSTDAVRPFETRSTSLRKKDTLIPGPSPLKGEGSNQLQACGWFVDLPLGARKRHHSKTLPFVLFVTFVVKKQSERLWKKTPMSSWYEFFVVQPRRITRATRKPP